MDTLKLNLKIKYVHNLINACNKLNIDINNLSNYLNDIQKSDTIIDCYTITEKCNESDIETIDYLYLKPWNKLTLIHKIIKIKEFVNYLDINNEDEKETLKDQLIELIKNKKIKNNINYDQNKGKIISISKLSVINDKYIVT